MKITKIIVNKYHFHLKTIFKIDSIKNNRLAFLDNPRDLKNILDPYC